MKTTHTRYYSPKKIICKYCGSDNVYKLAYISVKDESDIRVLHKSDETGIDYTCGDCGSSEHPSIINHKSVRRCNCLPYRTVEKETSNEPA